MALIDQRILIDAPTDAVWELLSSPDQLTRWHAGYSSVAVLTTQAGGVGARRRCTLRTGKDVIEEITAWVDGLGYEYRLIQGGPFRALQGRFRLQALPDGTSIQWTISYQPKGVIGLVRDALGGRRSMAEMMAASLRQLRREIDQRGLRMTADERARVAMQGRLNVEQRAHYQRRYAPPPGMEIVASAAAPEVAPTADAAPGPTPALLVAEPPLIPSPPTPSFVAQLTAEPEESAYDYDPKADTQPTPPPGLREAIAAQLAAQQTQDTPPAPEIPPVTVEEPGPAPDHQRITPPRGIPAVTPPTPETPPVLIAQAGPAPDHQRITPPRGIPAVTPPTPETPPVSAPKLEPESHPAVQAQAAPIENGARARPNLPPQTPKTDTGEISIWDVFGIPRPSQQDQAALDSLLGSLDQPSRPRSVAHPVRVRRVTGVWGLRLRLALRAVRVRLHRSITHRQGSDGWGKHKK